MVGVVVPVIFNIIIITYPQIFWRTRYQQGKQKRGELFYRCLESLQAQLKLKLAVLAKKDYYFMFLFLFSKKGAKNIF